MLNMDEPWKPLGRMIKARYNRPHIWFRLSRVSKSRETEIRLDGNPDERRDSGWQPKDEGFLFEVMKIFSNWLSGWAHTPGMILKNHWIVQFKYVCYVNYISIKLLLIEVSLIYYVVLVSSLLSKAIFNQNKNEIPKWHMP